MSQLNTTEMALVDRLFGMYSGYVLDFTNDRFASFFKRDLGIDIYHVQFANYGDSKGKRLRAFLELAPDSDVVRALVALWEYRETSVLSLGEVEKVPNARQQLSNLLVKLGGGPLPADPNASPAPASGPTRPSEDVLAGLEREFLALREMGDAPQQRGHAFERFLKRWFDTWGLEARSSFTTTGEQIDGAFQHDGSTYLVEAKWHQLPVNAQMLLGFQGKLLERPDWARGLYVSNGGFSEGSSNAFTARRLIMMDGADIHQALSRRLDLGEVIRRKVRHHAERKEPLASVTNLFKG